MPEPDPIDDRHHPGWRSREHTTHAASELADQNRKDSPEHLLREIYKEGNNTHQPDTNRMAKLLMKCSALFVVLSEAQAKENAKIVALTVNLKWMTVAIIGLTLAQVVIGLSSCRPQASSGPPQAVTSPSK